MNPLAVKKEISKIALKDIMAINVLRQFYFVKLTIDPHDLTFQKLCKNSFSLLILKFYLFYLIINTH